METIVDPRVYHGYTDTGSMIREPYPFLGVWNAFSSELSTCLVIATVCTRAGEINFDQASPAVPSAYVGIIQINYMNSDILRWKV
jgi:hypothetical protein